LAPLLGLGADIQNRPARHGRTFGIDAAMILNQLAQFDDGFSGFIVAKQGPRWACHSKCHDQTQQGLMETE
jgi:hypothetical protein